MKAQTTKNIALYIRAVQNINRQKGIKRNQNNKFLEIKQKIRNGDELKRINRKEQSWTEQNRIKWNGKELNSITPIKIT